MSYVPYHEIKYRPEIDGLRALAVLPVIFYHAGFSLFQGGYVGVDVFFVISGYLITSIIMLEIEGNKFSFIKFYERRAKRLIPALLFVILCCLPFAWILMLPNEMVRFSQSLIAVASFSSNIFFWLTSDYFSPAAENYPLLHTWSLAVEEQFYLVFPFLMIYLMRLERLKAVSIILIIFILSLTLSILGSNWYPVVNFYMLPTRAWELLAGSLLVFFSPLISKMRGKLNSDLIAISGLVLIVYSVLFFDSSLRFPSSYTLVPVLGTMMIIAFAVDGGMIARFLSMRYLVSIGLLSYSLYLWHQPVLAFSRLFYLERLPFSVTVSVLIIVFVLSLVTFNYIEKPFRKMTMNSGVAIASTLIALFIVAAVGFAFYFSPKNLKNNFSDNLVSLIDSATPNPRRSECHKDNESNLDPKVYCTYPDHSNPNIAVFGDSHGVEPAEFLGKELENIGGVSAFTFSGCGPVSPLRTHVSNECQQWSIQTQRYLASQSSIETIYVFYRLYSYVCGSHEGKYPKVPDKCEYSSLEELAASLSFFSNNGKRVYLVLQVPEVKVPIQNLILLSAPDSSGKWVSIRRQWWDERRAYSLNYLSKLDLGGAVVLDPSDFFCDQLNCFATDLYGAYYFDDNHLSRYGSLKLAKFLLTESR